MKVIETDIKSIKPYPKNPRNNENAIDEVTQSISSYGFVQPIVVDKKNVIVIGHTRYHAALKLKLKKVPVVFATDLSPKKIKALRIADNKVGEIATWDFDLLADELDGLNNFFTGFDGEELNNILGDVGKVDFPDLPSGERGELRQITFTMHSSQLDVVNEAVDLIINNSDVSNNLNDNKNGNAIFYICKEYLDSND